jgi:hypothetical protein
MSIWVKETPYALSAHLTIGINTNETKEIIEKEYGELVVERVGERVGELVFQRIDTNAYAVQIHIDDAYQHQGWSRRLFKELFQTFNLDLDTWLVIDADASNGYWDYLGFVANRYGYDYMGRRMPTIRGYEKIATVRDVKKFTGN